MARARCVVHFEDGTSETFNPNRPRLLLDFEKEFGMTAPETQAQAAWMAHHAVAREVPFEKWVDTVEEIETLTLPDSSLGKDGPSSTG